MVAVAAAPELRPPSVQYFQEIGLTMRAGCRFFLLLGLSCLAHGLYSDNVTGRIIDGNDFGGPNNTVDTCVATCQANNFTVAGMEYASECIPWYIPLCTPSDGLPYSSVLYAKVTGTVFIL